MILTLQECIEYRTFAHYVARLIFSNPLTDDFEAEKELICRKLNELGIVKKTDKEWIYESEEKEFKLNPDSKIASTPYPLNEVFCSDSKHILTGEWEEPFEMNGKSYHKCTNCHISSELILINKFCPNCGAKMKVGDEE